MSNNDIYSNKPRIGLGLTRVGLTGIVIPFQFTEGDLHYDLQCEIDLFTDLPADRRGGDFSRQTKSINSILRSEEKISGLEEITPIIAAALENTLDYAESFQVYLKARMLTYDRENTILHNDTLLEDTTISRKEGQNTTVGVEVQGVTACPCTMEKIREQMTSRNPELKDMLSKIPIITHNQRNFTRVHIELDGKHSRVIPSLLSAIRDVIGDVPSSAPVSTDVENIDRSHTKPLLIEDVVREVAASLRQKLPDYNPESRVIISSRSEESIHPHDAFAEFEGKFGQLV